MRDKVGEAGESLPARGGGREAVCEAGVDDKIGEDAVAGGDEEVDGVGAAGGPAGVVGVDQGLGEVIELDAELEFGAEEFVIDRECLRVLGTADFVGDGPGGLAVLLGEEDVGVVVETAEVAAEEERDGVGVAAEVDVGRGAGVHRVQVGDGDDRDGGLVGLGGGFGVGRGVRGGDGCGGVRRRGSVSVFELAGSGGRAGGKEDDLRAELDGPGVARGEGRGGVVAGSERLECGLHHEALRNGELHHLIDAVLRGGVGRGERGEVTLLKLEIADGWQRGRVGDGGATGVSCGNVFGLGGGCGC